MLLCCQVCKERWMSHSDVCWASAGEASLVIDELTQRPSPRGSNWCTLAIKPPYCPEEATRGEERGRVKEQTLCKASRCWRVALWACRVNHRVLCGSNQRTVSEQLDNQDRGVINALVWSGCLWRASLTLCFHSLFSGDPASESISSLLSYRD